jgi:hypothetical protein
MNAVDASLHRHSPLAADPQGKSAEWVWPPARAGARARAWPAAASTDGGGSDGGGVMAAVHLSRRSDDARGR